MSVFEILDGACRAQVEEIGSAVAIVGTTALALGNVCETMFEADALPEKAASCGRAGQLSEAVLESFRPGIETVRPPAVIIVHLLSR